MFNAAQHANQTLWLFQKLYECLWWWCTRSVNAIQSFHNIHRISSRKLQRNQLIFIHSYSTRAVVAVIVSLTIDPLLVVHVSFENIIPAQCSTWNSGRVPRWKIHSPSISCRKCRSQKWWADLIDLNIFHCTQEHFYVGY